MYNKAFNLDITATSPFAWEEKEEAYIGITITGWVHTDKMDFLDDLDFGDKVDKKGLALILSGGLPIDGPVPLKFTQPEGLEFKFANRKPVGKCTLEAVEVGPLDDEGKMNAKLKIKLKDIDEAFAGEIVSHLPKPKILDWIILEDNVQPPTMKCLRCGATRELHIPATITDVLKQAAGFADTHRFCE